MFLTTTQRRRGFAVLVLLSALPAAAQRKADAAADTITKQQAEAILGELREMRQLLGKLVQLQTAGGQGAAAPAPGAPPVVTLKLSDGPMLGDSNAPLTMVEYIDLQCPFCKQFDTQTFAEIRKNLIDTGKLRYFSRDLPLDMHPYANKAAVAAHCAGEQGQFWRMREVLLANSTNLAPDAILGYARTAGLDAGGFANCLNSTKYDATIRAGISEGASVGIQGTPSFVIGKSTPTGVRGIVLVGAQPYTTFEARVKEAESR